MLKQMNVKIPRSKEFENKLLENVFFDFEEYSENKPDRFYVKYNFRFVINIEFTFLITSCGTFSNCIYTFSDKNFNLVSDIDMSMRFSEESDSVFRMIFGKHKFKYEVSSESKRFFLKNIDLFDIADHDQLYISYDNFYSLLKPC